MKFRSISAAYYGAVYALVYSPGYLVNERSAQVETNLYFPEKPDGELGGQEPPILSMQIRR